MALPRPTSHLIVTQGELTTEVEVFRCDTDGAVVFRTKEYNTQPLFGMHSGHKLKQPVILNAYEIDQIMEELKLE